MNTKNKKSSAKNPECQCGCGAATKGGRFLPGHDAKLKKTLIDAALGGSKRATTKLETLGWAKFFEVKRPKESTGKRRGTTAKKDEAQPARRRGGRPRKPRQNETATQTEGDGSGRDYDCRGRGDLTRFRA